MPSVYPSVPSVLILGAGSGSSFKTSTVTTASLSNPSGTELATATGSTSTNDLAKWDGSGDVIDSGLSATALTLPVWLIGSLATNASVTLSGGNVAQLYGVVLPYYLSTSEVDYDVQTGDTGSYSYDIGFYNSSGTLVIHTGNISHTNFTSGLHDGVPWTSAATLPPGKYYFAITTSCTSSCSTTAAKLSGTSAAQYLTFQSGGTVSVSSGGTLNGPVTLPADTWTASGFLPGLGVH
jgi:hypothetical protein